LTLLSSAPANGLNTDQKKNGSCDNASAHSFGATTLARGGQTAASVKRKRRCHMAADGKELLTSRLRLDVSSSPQFNAIDEFGAACPAPSIA
jgi:hypothetical protein